MHEVEPKMDVTQTIVASTSQTKSEMASDEFVLSSTMPKEAEAVDLDLQVDFVDPSTGKKSINNNSTLISPYAFYLITSAYQCFI